MINTTYEKIRDKNDLTLNKIARELEMNISGCVKIERCEIDLSLSKVFKIGAILNISVTSLLFFKIAHFFF
jgi:transcriptional regulator with XRE-family HTH domain